MNTLETDSRLCGLGKSKSMQEALSDSLSRNTVLNPTCKTNQEYVSALPGSLQVDKDAVLGGRRVADLLHEAIQDITNRIICTTHESGKNWLRATYGSSADTREGMNLIIEEALEGAIKEVEINLDQDVWSVLKSKLSFDTWPQNCNVFEVSPGATSGLDEIASGRTQCEVLGSSKSLKEVARTIADPLYLTLIPKASFERLESKLVENGNGLFCCVSFIRRDIFEGFNSVRCLSAFFHQTEFAIALRLQGVQFKDVTPACRVVYPNSERLTINYFTDQTWTTTLRSRQDARGITNLQKVLAYISDDSGGANLIYNANEKERNVVASVLPEPTGELVVETHGRNDLRHYNCAAFLGSRNMSPEAGRVVEQLGIPREGIDRARGVLAGYQFFMRTSLRNQDSLQPVTLYCGDKRLAEFMGDIFPQATLVKRDVGLQFESLDDKRSANGGRREGAGRKAKYPSHWTNADKVAYKRSGNGLPYDIWYLSRHAGELFSPLEI